MAELLSGVIAILNALLSQFVDSDQYFELLPDGEWALHGHAIPTEKTQDLAAAIADIIVNQVQFFDKILQVLAGQS